MASLEGMVDDLNNHGTYDTEVRFYQGCGKRVQGKGFILLMMSSTSRCEMSEKQQNGWKVPGCGSTFGTGKAEELEERRESTFCLKKVIQLLHLSSVGFWIKGLRFKDVIYSGEKLFGISRVIVDDFRVELWSCISPGLCIGLLMFSISLFSDAAQGHAQLSPIFCSSQV